jgi:capsule polysaccharide export protein KpsE/RkpR
VKALVSSEKEAEYLMFFNLILSIVVCFGLIASQRYKLFSIKSNYF